MLVDKCQSFINTSLPSPPFSCIRLRLWSKLLSSSLGSEIGSPTSVTACTDLIMEWLGHAELNFTHAPSPRKVQEKDGHVTDLLSICEKATPPCRLNPLLFNGHLQTMWTATKPAGPKIYYKRKIFDADHKIYHGTFAVDFAVEPFEAPDDPSLSRRTAYFTPEEFEHIGSDDCKPMLVVLHGLSGGSHEIYLRHTIAPLIGEGGWEVCVVNSRGCARSKITSGVLYNARATWDIRQVKDTRAPRKTSH